MEAKSFEEGLAEVTEMLKRLQFTLLFHQSKLEESFRRARQGISLASEKFHRASEKFHRSIIAAIKEEKNQEGNVPSYGVQLNQRGHKSRMKARLFWKKFVVACVQPRKPRKLFTSLGNGFESLDLHEQLQVCIRILKKIYQDYYMLLKYTKGIQRRTWDPGITWLNILKEHLEDKFKNEFAQHRTYVDEQITTMQNRFTAELRAIRIELTAATSSMTAAMERKHEELMKMLSSSGLPKDQASLGVAPTKTYKAVNELPKRLTTIYKPNNDLKGLQVDDLSFPYFAYGDKPKTLKLRNNGVERHDTLYQGQKGGHHGSDYRMRKLKMPLFDREDSHGWIYKVERYFEVKDIKPREQLRAAVLCMKGQALSWFHSSEARSPFHLWEGLKRRLLEIFQPSQEGTLHEQFLVIKQEGSAREYVSLFETLAGQLVWILQKSQENSQNRTNTNTGTELSVQKPENAIKVNKSQPMVNSGQP
ncbi:ankyrin repeat-containing protein [Tanacetum coccineum]